MANRPLHLRPDGGGIGHAMTQFVSYGLGMGLILILVTVSVALFRGTFTGRLRSLLPYVHRIGAAFVLAAGLYIVYYWVVIGDILRG